jgi:hypothetical protein
MEKDCMQRFISLNLTLLNNNIYWYIFIALLFIAFDK